MGEHEDRTPEQVLSGCTCQPVRGAHKPPCPWAMSTAGMLEDAPDTHEGGQAQIRQARREAWRTGGREGALTPDSALNEIEELVEEWMHGADLADWQVRDLIDRIDWLNAQLTAGRELPTPWRLAQLALDDASEQMRHGAVSAETAAIYLNEMWWRCYGRPYDGNLTPDPEEDREALTDEQRQAWAEHREAVRRELAP